MYFAISALLYFACMLYFQGNFKYHKDINKSTTTSKYISISYHQDL